VAAKAHSCGHAAGSVGGANWYVCSDGSSRVLRCGAGDAKSEHRADGFAEFICRTQPFPDPNH